MEQSRVGAIDYSIQERTGSGEKGTRSPAPIPYNPQAAGKAGDTQTGLLGGFPLWQTQGRLGLQTTVMDRSVTMNCPLHEETGVCQGIGTIFGWPLRFIQMTPEKRRDKLRGQII